LAAAPAVWHCPFTAAGALDPREVQAVLLGHAACDRRRGADVRRRRGVPTGFAAGAAEADRIISRQYWWAHAETSSASPVSHVRIA